MNQGQSLPSASGTDAPISNFSTPYPFQRDILLTQQDQCLDDVSISIRNIKEKSYMIHSELESQAM